MSWLGRTPCTVATSLMRAVVAVAGCTTGAGAAAGAACTGVTNGALNPPPKCEDPAPPNFAVCRCCKVGEEKGGGDSVP